MQNDSSLAPVAACRARLWLGAGFFACVVAAVWGRIDAGGEPLRLAFVWLGVLAAGIGVRLGFRDSSRPRLSGKAPGLPLLVLALVCAALALGVSFVLVLSWGEIYLLGLRPGLAFLVWLFVAPLSARAGWQTWRRLLAHPTLEARDRAGLSLLAGGVTAFVACFALVDPGPEWSSSWYTIQHFLFVLGLVCFFAAPLTLVDLPTRRWVVSGLLVFHLLGICTAALGAGSSPWIVTQLWTRIYRPYLLFLYLNNAYHFYAPEPGPASYLWFRLYYLDDQNREYAEWYKVPRLDDKGRHGHVTSLEYQRMLSMTESTIQTETFQPESAWFEKLLARRLAATPEAAKKEAIVGQAAPAIETPVPMHPAWTKSAQFKLPQAPVKWSIESYARHVIWIHQQEFPERRYQSVRIYRVVHQLPPKDMYFAGWSPTDPEFYTPIYLGRFNPSGEMLDKDDPLLYWMLPILRDRPNDLSSPIKDWARHHAGDPYWIRVIGDAGFPKWVDDNGKE